MADPHDRKAHDLPRLRLALDSLPGRRGSDMDFLKSISEIKREPLDLKEALERVAAYDKERDKYGYEARTILEQNEYDFLNIKHVRLEEVFPSLLGFDYEKYTMLRNISNLQKCNEKIVEIGEKEIREIPEDLPDSAKKEIRDHIERDIAKYRIQGSLYSSGGSALCNRINHVLELFRRAYISGDVEICGDWIDLDTIVDTKVFFEWAQRNGFYIPEEVSCFFGTPAATTTTTTEPGHDQQAEEIDPKDFAERELAQGKAPGQVMLALVELYDDMPKWKAAGLALCRPVVDLDEFERDKLKSRFYDRTKKFRQ